MRTVAAVILVAAALASSAGAQFQQRRGGRGGFGRGPGGHTNPAYDGAFQFCRVMYRNAPDGDGGGWAVDSWRADENLSFRLSELTRTTVSRASTDEWNHVALVLTDTVLLSRCPFIMLTEPGGAYFDAAEAEGLRTYLQKGGFLWADDFWGDYAFEHWMNELRKALPSSDYPPATCRSIIRSSTCHDVKAIRRSRRSTSVDRRAHSGARLRQRRPATCARCPIATAGSSSR